MCDERDMICESDIMYYIIMWREPSMRVIWREGEKKRYDIWKDDMMLYMKVIWSDMTDMMLGKW